MPIFLYLLVEMWSCKGCKETVSSRSTLLNHYKLKHLHFGRSAPFPCTYPHCPCTFRTWNALIVHQSKIHSTGVTSKEHAIFSCHLCTCNDLASERDYFAHVNTHLKRNETVSCMFLDCDFKTNVYCTFKSHKNRKHCHHSLVDFKPGVVITTESASVDELEANSEENVEQLDTATPSSSWSDSKDLQTIIEQRFAAALLKLEHLVHVPSTAVDVFLGELHHLISSAPVPLSCEMVRDIFHQRNLSVDDLVIRKTVDSICSGSPVQRSIQKGGPLSTAYLRKLYYKENFSVVQPVEYVLDAKSKHSYQYVPILKSLQQLLSRQEVIDQIVEGHQRQDDAQSGVSYKCSKDGSLFKDNPFFSRGKPRIILQCYVDDFEVCNPLGTSRKKHKLCAVYWVLGNLRPGSHSSLSSIYLAVLCKTDHVKIYGYDRILEPLLQDLKTLEELGVYVPLLGESVKGTIFSVVADNLGAHSIAGFMESFSVEHYCRFCTGKSSDIQLHSVASGAFELRTKELHQAHVKQVEDTGTACCGMKRSVSFSCHLWLST